jgi:hypothetical protein
MSQLTSIAQGHYQNADRQVTQLEELQALVMEKEEIIAERDLSSGRIRSMRVMQ